MNDLVPIIAPTIGVAAAVASGFFATRVRAAEHKFGIQREEIQADIRRQERREVFDLNVLRQIEEPLLYAASDLQSRLWNILDLRLVKDAGDSDPSRHEKNLSEYTAFLFAQYFGWAEALRQASLVGEMAKRGGDYEGSRVDATSSVVASIREINDALRSESTGPGFMLFAGEQHAIGELMLTGGETAALPSVERYASFATRFRSEDGDFRAWFEPIVQGVDGLGSGIAQPRLALVQNHLVDLMLKLEPNSKIYKARQKFPTTGIRENAREETVLSGGTAPAQD